MPKFTEAIYLATSSMMNTFSDLSIFGLGVSYPNGADGTMGLLGKEFPSRVFDTPASESTITGLAVGAAITGSRTLVHHGRVEFALFAADQIVTQAANWNYMYGGKSPVPVTFRIALGRQWGNGPQHTGSHIPLFSSTPGLKVVCPSSPKNAYKLLKWALADNNPVVFLEPRWLYQLDQEFEIFEGPSDLPCPELVMSGENITVVSYGEGVLEAVKAAQELSRNGVSCEVIDLQVLTKPNYELVTRSLQKTGRLIVIDPYSRSAGVGTEVVSEIAQLSPSGMVSQPLLLTPPFTPVPTAPPLSEAFYSPVRSQNISVEIAKMLGLKFTSRVESFEELHLPPKTKLGSNWEIL